MTPPEFVLFGPAHLTAMFLTLAVPGALIAWARRSGSEALPRYIAYAIGTLLLLNEVGSFAWRWQHNLLTMENALPMHLCDWATFTTIITCFWRKQWSYELTYFWGLAGTLQAIITPDLHYGFPSIWFFVFFITHCGLVGAIIYLTFAFPLRPTWASIPRAYGWLLFYAVCAGLVNWIAGTNYGYVCGKPNVASMMDYFGPWPWYIPVMTIVALLFFVVYYLPFAFADWWTRRSSLSAK